MKTTIDKKDLKEIYDIACSTWKPIIEKYAQRNPFGCSVDFTKEEVNKMIQACDKNQLPIVKKVFDIQDLTTKIKSVEDACKFLGEDDEEVVALRSLQSINLPRNIVAEQEMVVVTRAINDRHEFDWDDSNEYKYFTWWYLGKNFRLCCVGNYCSTSSCSARLCFTTRENAEFASKQFKNIYKDFMNK